MAKQKQSWTDQIRSAAIASGKTQSELAEASKVAQPVISHFLRGTRTITLASAEKLAKVLGLELKEVKNG